MLFLLVLLVTRLGESAGATACSCTTPVALRMDGSGTKIRQFSDVNFAG